LAAKTGAGLIRRSVKRNITEIIKDRFMTEPPLRKLIKFMINFMYQTLPYFVKIDGVLRKVIIDLKYVVSKDFKYI
jgi:hypothetical protein